MFIIGEFGRHNLLFRHMRQQLEDLIANLEHKPCLCGNRSNNLQHRWIGIMNLLFLRHIKGIAAGLELCSYIIENMLTIV